MAVQQNTSGKILLLTGYTNQPPNRPRVAPHGANLIPKSASPTACLAAILAPVEFIFTKEETTIDLGFCWRWSDAICRLSRLVQLYFGEVGGCAMIWTGECHDFYRNFSKPFASSNMSQSPQPAAPLAPTAEDVVMAALPSAPSVSLVCVCVCLCVVLGQSTDCWCPSFFELFL